MNWRLGCFLAMICWCSSHAAAQLSVMVYTENSPPYQLQGKHQVEGLSTEKVRAILQLADIDATIEMMPWARALQVSSRQSNALIYAIARTPEREPYFTWIAPVANFKLGVITLRKRQDLKLTDEMTLNHLTVASQRDDIASFWLEKHGFVENRNKLLCADIVCSWTLLKNGGVDFIIEDPNLIAATAPLVGLTADDIMLQFTIDELDVVGYLAANKQLNRVILDKLIRAAADLGFH